MIEGQQTNCDAPEMPDFPDPQVSNESGEASKEEHYLATDTLISEEIKAATEKLNTLCEKAKKAGLSIVFATSPLGGELYTDITRVIRY